MPHRSASEGAFFVPFVQSGAEAVCFSCIQSGHVLSVATCRAAPPFLLIALPPPFFPFHKNAPEALLHRAQALSLRPVMRSFSRYDFSRTRLTRPYRCRSVRIPLYWAVPKWRRAALFSPRGKMLALGHGPEAALCNVRRFFRKHGDIGPVSSSLRRKRRGDAGGVPTILIHACDRHLAGR